MPPFRQLLPAILIGWLLIGCSGVPAYSVRVEEPHKDVLLVEVEVDRPLSTPQYRSIAERELHAVLSGARSYRTPVYEVRFEYLAPSTSGAAVAERVATYVWRQEASSPVHVTLSGGELGSR